MFEPDPYEWLDPFEERQRAQTAEYRAATARDDGRREVLRAVTDRKTGEMHEMLDHAVEQCARRAVEQTIWPWIAAHKPMFQEVERRREMELDAYSAAIRPTMAAAHGALLLSADYAEFAASREPLIRFNVLSMKPIEVHCAVRADI